ncbi:MAG: helix-turn-helix transcriptional regulator [Geodermatophilaceae bacterium]|nr:helix-turn-helix transcriptional regulator [Geodermatophilaceae bacterium]
MLAAVASMGGDLIREARKRAALTQRELAERAGTTQSAIARLESGRVDPGFERVRTLMRLCGFNLLVALDPWDDSDLAQAIRLLEMSPEQRLEYMVRAANLLSELNGLALAGAPDGG